MSMPHDPAVEAAIRASMGNGAAAAPAQPQMVAIRTEQGAGMVTVEVGTFMVLSAIADTLERIEAMFKDAQGEGTDATNEGAAPPATGSGLLEA